jgi:nitrite reductase/ring-hydroxylating ferredoxin subunit
MRVKIGRSADFPADTLMAVTGENINLVAARVDGTIYAAQGLCPHLNLSLSRGTLDGCTLTCPWHGSKFDLATGKNLDWVKSFGNIKLPGWSQAFVAMGQEPTGLTTYPVTEVGDEVFVEL